MGAIFAYLFFCMNFRSHLSSFKNKLLGFYWNCMCYINLEKIYNTKFLARSGMYLRLSTSLQRFSKVLLFVSYTFFVHFTFIFVRGIFFPIMLYIWLMLLQGKYSFLLIHHNLIMMNQSYWTFFTFSWLLLILYREMITCILSY